MADPQLAIDLIRTVQDALEAEATRRSASALPGLGDKAQREAFAVAVLKREFLKLDERRLSDGAARLTPRDEAELTERVLAEAVGLGPADLLLADETIEEIVATRHDLVFVMRSDGTRELVEDVLWRSEKALSDWVAHLARTAGRTERQFNSQNPTLVMRIGEGLRLAATRDVSQHVSFALRRNTISKGGGLGGLVGRGMMPPVVADLFRACMASNEMRIVIVGGTAAGKTTLARACLDELEPLQRVVIIEDTAEIDLFDPALHPDVESWEERHANSEGEGAVTIGQLVKHALRYRPDWLVCGEVRDSDAAVPMLKAMTHGQSSLTTVHANSAVAGLDKLALYLGTGEDRLPIDVAHHQLSQAIDFVVHVDRGVGGKRFVSEIAEVAGYDAGRSTTNTIYTATDGDGHTMQRLTQAHVARLAAAGFDVNALGGGWR
jgi:Flp pilus assembly CpaF family ATPase